MAGKSRSGAFTLADDREVSVGADRAFSARRRKLLPGKFDGRRAYRRTQVSRSWVNSAELVGGDGQVVDDRLVVLFSIIGRRSRSTSYWRPRRRCVGAAASGACEKPPVASKPADASSVFVRQRWAPLGQATGAGWWALRRMG